MKNEFVPYEMAVKLRQLGFDEDCLAYYDVDQELKGIGEAIFGKTYLSRNSTWQDFVAAPLWQQVIDWLRNTHEMNIFVGYRPEGKKWLSHSYNSGPNAMTYARERFEKNRDPKKFDDYHHARNAAVEEAINNIPVN